MKRLNLCIFREKKTLIKNNTFIDMFVRIINSLSNQIILNIQYLILKSFLTSNQLCEDVYWNFWNIFHFIYDQKYKFKNCQQVCSSTREMGIFPWNIHVPEKFTFNILQYKKSNIKNSLMYIAKTLLVCLIYCNNIVY